MCLTYYTLKFLKKKSVFFVRYFFLKLSETCWNSVKLYETFFETFMNFQATFQILKFYFVTHPTLPTYFVVTRRPPLYPRGRIKARWYNEKKKPFLVRVRKMNKVQNIKSFAFKTSFWASTRVYFFPRDAQAD